MRIPSQHHSSALEQGFFELLSKRLAEDEPCVRNYLLPLPPDIRWRVYADAYLPRGCKALSVPAKTYIELKGSLRFDSVNRWFLHHKALRADGQDVTFYLLYTRDDEGYGKKQDSEELQFYVRSVNDFLALPPESDETAVVPYCKSEQECMAEARAEIASQKLAFFLGAGVSIDAGLPSWSKLLNRLYIAIGGKHSETAQGDALDTIRKSCFDSSIIAGRYLRQMHGLNPCFRPFRDMLHEALWHGKLKAEPQALNAITDIIRQDRTPGGRWSIEAVITYNYDDLLEQMLQRKGVAQRPIYNDNRAEYGYLPIYHVHGIIPQGRGTGNVEPTPVLGEDEYHELYKEAYHWANVEQIHALSRCCCIFVGLSLTDPNLRRLLDIVRMMNPGSTAEKPRHYAFLYRREFRKQNTSTEPTQGDDPTRQESHMRIQESILRQLGLNVIWYDHYPELPQKLSQLFTAP